MNNKYRVMLPLITAAFLLSACKNVPPVTSGIGSEQIALGQEYNKFLQVDNSELSTQLYISDIKSRLNNELLQINLSLTSTYKKSLQLQYQFQWFDENNFVIEAGKSPWQALELHGKQTTTVAALAPSTPVTSFKLYVRKVPEKFFKF